MTDSTEPRPNPVPATAVPGRLVLVVDDEELVRSTARAVLRDAGYAVVEAADGVEAMAICRRDSGQLSAVLLDMTMPRMSGEQVLARLWELRPGLPVIVSTGYGELEANRRFRGLPVGAFLPKPYTAGQLTETMARAMASRPEPAA